MKTFFTFLIAGFIAFGFSSCITTNYSIKQGVVKDDFDIKLTEKNIVLNKDKYFQIQDLNLEYNKTRYSPWYLFPFFFTPIIVNSTAPVNGNTDFLGLYKSNRIKSYKITFNENGNQYFGRIAFFKAFNYAKNEGVCSYYRITVPEQKLAQASEGRTSCVYEYYTNNVGNVYPTWIIWVSDADIF